MIFLQIIIQIMINFPPILILSDSKRKVRICSTLNRGITTSPKMLSTFLKFRNETYMEETVLRNNIFTRKFSYSCFNYYLNIDSIKMKPWNI